MVIVDIRFGNAGLIRDKKMDDKIINTLFYDEIFLP